MAATVAGLTERYAALQAVPECDVCQADIRPGDAVSLGDSLVYCPSCAWEEATHKIGALLLHDWSPVNVREMERARAAVAILLATVDARIAEARHV